ncbi:vesicle-trafficking protein SEC22a isoform X1 [Meles meles]|uniref:vesicle-trafficking protein SEC22a isoform X1 n=1 Tax=Meles meles TaxID=9662 RepID=UPI001E69F15E|nr:vesicle-trafficking protein SEC22a isoform X1 [Meles meles]XP_045858087.1 vesicle-trafficking protein SEC22a isoform X1 [Meles meles]
MSMILSASVIRVRDGLPLSASTDYEQGTGVQECRKYFKMLSKKLAQLPDRCTLKTGHYNINFISSLGVSYMMLCTENYPNVLAFSFLDELQKEFITTYNMMKTNTAVRPYCFIEFDNFIQRTKQRYNNPRSLSTKINLSDMQMEIKLRPPYQISMCELGSANGVTSAFSIDYKGAGKISSAHQRLEPVTLSGIVAFILSLLCGALNLIRGFHAIESLLQSDGEDFNYIVAFFLGTAACLYQPPAPWDLLCSPVNYYLPRTRMFSPLIAVMTVALSQHSLRSSKLFPTQGRCLPSGAPSPVPHQELSALFFGLEPGP